MPNFNPLFVTPQWMNEYYTKYPHGLSVMENLIEWVNQTNEVIDWVNMTPQKLTALISEFNSDGSLNFIINEAIQTEMNDIVTYKPNGVDDTDNILSILADKGKVHLTSGTYICRPFTMTADQHIQGAGVGKTILKLKDQQNSSFIKMQNAVRSSIRDLTIDGNKENNPFFRRENPDLFDSIDLLLVEVLPGFELSNVGLVLDNLKITNGRNNGLNFNSKNWNWVMHPNNIQIDSCDGYGFKNASTDNIFSNFYISNCGLAGAWIGGSHNKFINFKIDGSGIVRDNPFNYPSDGANLILSSVSASQFINFDIQSAHYVGAKIVNSSSIEFSSSFDSNGLTEPGIGLIVINSNKIIGNLIFTDVMSRQPTDLYIYSNCSDISFNSETVNETKITNEGLRTVITSLSRLNEIIKTLII